MAFAASESRTCFHGCGAGSSMQSPVAGCNHDVGEVPMWTALVGGARPRVRAAYWGSEAVSRAAEPISTISALYRSLPLSALISPPRSPHANSSLE